MGEVRKPLLRVRDLKKHFPIVRGFFNKVVGQVRAVDGVTFDLYDGECLELRSEDDSSLICVVLGGTADRRTPGRRSIARSANRIIVAG